MKVTTTEIHLFAKPLVRLCSTIALLVVIATTSACSSLKVTRTPFSSGSVLVMPPANAVQGGKVHPVAANSGSYLQLALVRRLDGRGGFTAKAYPADSRFSSESTYSFEDAVSAAASSGYRYCLVVRLGEFRDAAPMTFRDDFATLYEARLIDTQSRRDVWALLSPYRASGTNLGSYYPLLEKISDKVTKSILQNNYGGTPPSVANPYSTSLNTVARVNPVASTQPSGASEVVSLDQGVEKLRALKRARDEGILTESEYQRKKKTIVETL